MRIRLMVFCLFIISGWLPAQTINQYSIKLQSIYGNIIPHDSHVKQLIQNPVSGAELSVDFQTMNEEPWYQFNGFPKLGASTTWLNLGNPKLLGHAVAFYPHISYPIIRSDFLKLNIKGGAGLCYATKTYYNTNKDSLGVLLPFDDTNTAISAHLNVFLAAGGNLEIPLCKGWSITAGYTWNHISNGSTVAPNSGLNMLNSSIGIKYFPNYRNFHFPQKQALPDIPKKIGMEIIASGGFRQLYYLDNKTYPIITLTVYAFRPLTNFYRMGMALDGFYDGVFDGSSSFKRYYITSNELKNKLRLGISWQHELLMGKLTAGFGFGLYLYDPLKNLSPVDNTTGFLIHPEQNKPLFYKYKIGRNGNESGEDGWFYSKAMLKYSISKNYFLSIGLKTHLQRAEFIEWGIGYQL